MTKARGDWTDLFLAFRLVLDPRKLWLAFKGVVLSIILIELLVAIFASVNLALGVPLSLPLAEIHDLRQPLPGAGAEAADTDVGVALWQGRFADAVRASRAFVAGLVAKSAAELRDVALDPRHGPYDRVVALWGCQGLATLAALVLLVAFVLLFVWSYYGAAIMRLAGVEYALGERLELKSATAYTRRKHQAFYGPPLGLAIAMFILSVLIALNGLLIWNAVALFVAFVGLLAVGFCAAVVRDRTRSSGRAMLAGLAGLVVLGVVVGVIDGLGLRVPYLGEVLLGLLSPLALVGGLLIALLGIWLVLGLPLMAGTVATSNVGAFEAWSRSFHYLFVHPWRYAFYALVGLAHGAACMAVVYAVRVAAEWAAFVPLTAAAIVVSHDETPRVLSLLLTAGVVLLDLVVLAFGVSYVFASQAIAYLLLRRSADGTPVSEVHLEPRDRERLAPPPPPGGDGPGAAGAA